METVTDYFGGLQNHYRWCMQPRNKKKHLLLGRKAMTNLDSILKSRNITLLTKVCLVKALVFPVVMYGPESWITKKAEHQRIDAFELWCWRRLLRVPLTARRSNQSILKEIDLEYSLEGLMLKHQYFGILWRQKQKRTTEDGSISRTINMVGWHHRLNEHESEQTLGDGEGQGSLACCNPQGRWQRVRHPWVTEWQKGHIPAESIFFYRFPIQPSLLISLRLQISHITVLFSRAVGNLSISSSEYY